jgi:MbtH protein
MDRKDVLKYLRRSAGILPVAAMVAFPPSARAQWDEEDNTIYKVVYNDDDQHSIVPANQELAEGWYDTGMVGTKAECEAYLEEELRRIL